MTVEIYRKQPAAPANCEERARRAAICQRLGLGRQDIDSALDPARVYPQIEGITLAALCKWLPRSYSRAAGHWTAYRYDAVPTEALEEIEMAAGLGLFHDIELWTPERAPDPAAVGVVGPFAEHPWDRLTSPSRYFLLARWGESVLPLEEIRARVSVSSLPALPASLTGPAREALVKVMEAAYYQVTIYVRGFTWRKHCGQLLVKLHAGSEHLTLCQGCGHLERKPCPDGF